MLSNRSASALARMTIIGMLIIIFPTLINGQPNADSTNSRPSSDSSTTDTEFLITGRVTNERGKPIKDLKLNLNPMRFKAEFLAGGRTDADGRYAIRFPLNRLEEDPQYVMVRPDLSSHVEKNLLRHAIVGLTHGKASTRPTTSTVWSKATLRPSHAHQLDLVMEPAAVLLGVLTNGHGDPPSATPSCCSAPTRWM